MEEIQKGTRKHQLILGSVCMGAWFAIGVIALLNDSDFSHHTLPMSEALSGCLFGFFAWLLTRKFGGIEIFDALLLKLPSGVDTFVMLATLAIMGAMWILVLLLPLFGDWNKRSRPLLLVLQNVYAALQGLSPIFLWDW